MQNQQVRARATDDSIGTAVLVAEFDENRGVVNRIDDGADLSSRQAFCRPVGEQRDNVEQRGTLWF